jgi:enterochelin esterase-like enzyme
MEKHVFALRLGQTQVGGKGHGWSKIVVLGKNNEVDTEKTEIVVGDYALWKSLSDGKQIIHIKMEWRDGVASLYDYYGNKKECPIEGKKGKPVKIGDLRYAWIGTADDEPRFNVKGMRILRARLVDLDKPGKVEPIKMPKTITELFAKNTEMEAKEKVSASLDPTYKKCDIVGAKNDIIGNSFSPRAGKVTVKFDAVPSTSTLSGTIGLFDDSKYAFPESAILVQFTPEGTIKTSHGSAFLSDKEVKYSAGKTYSFRVAINTPANTYSLFVKPQGEAEIMVGKGYTFRSDQEIVNSWGAAEKSGKGQLQICNFSVEGKEAPIAKATPLPKSAGTIRDNVYNSRANNRKITVKIYTPPGYESSKERYPVVYNLHGMNGSYNIQWDRVRSSLIDAMEHKRVRPMIYVFVNGLGNTWFQDKEGTKAETTLIKELIPFIDKKYRTIANKEGRAIDGFSMGGAGALTIAFKYPELFSSVVSYGAALVKTGEGTAPYWLEKNEETIRKSLKIRMVCGSEDGLLKNNEEFRKTLESKKIPVEFVVVPGIPHCTQCLYEKVGLASLEFIYASFKGHANVAKAK